MSGLGVLRARVKTVRDGAGVIMGLFLVFCVSSALYCSKLNITSPVLARSFPSTRRVCFTGSHPESGASMLPLLSSGSDSTDSVSVSSEEVLKCLRAGLQYAYR